MPQQEKQTLPVAAEHRLFTVPGITGYAKKVTGAESKTFEDGTPVVRAFYNGYSVGLFVPVDAKPAPVETPK